MLPAEARTDEIRSNLTEAHRALADAQHRLAGLKATREKARAYASEFAHDLEEIVGHDTRRGRRARVDGAGRAQPRRGPAVR